jgi:hypothetical protein
MRGTVLAVPLSLAVAACSPSRLAIFPPADLATAMSVVWAVSRPANPGVLDVEAADLTGSVEIYELLDGSEVHVLLYTEPLSAHGLSAGTLMDASATPAGASKLPAPDAGGWLASVEGGHLGAWARSPEPSGNLAAFLVAPPTPPPECSAPLGLMTLYVPTRSEVAFATSFGGKLLIGTRARELYSVTASGAFALVNTGSTAIVAGSRDSHGTFVVEARGRIGRVDGLSSTISITWMDRVPGHERVERIAYDSQQTAVLTASGSLWKGVNSEWSLLHRFGGRPFDRSDLRLSYSTIIAVRSSTYAVLAGTSVSSEANVEDLGRLVGAAPQLDNQNASLGPVIGSSGGRLLHPGPRGLVAIPGLPVLPKGTLAFSGYHGSFMFGQADGAIRAYAGGVLCGPYPALTGTVAQLIDMGKPYGAVGDTEPRGIPVAIFELN